MNQLEVQYQEILHILDKLLANLGLMLEDYDVEYLTQADLYIEIFKIMFPVLEPVLNADFGEDITDEELIQYLIDVLAKDIIKMDLGHIRGELIAQGDAKNILNFLQLLFEISNMVVEKDDGDKDKKNSKNSKNSKKNKNQRLIRSSGNSADQIASSDQSSLEVNQQYNSVQGINAEFSNSSVVESNQEPSDAGAEEVYEDIQGHRVQNNKMVFDQHQQMKAMKDGASRESRSVSRISEVSKSKESSEYDRGVKKMSRDEFNPAALVKGRVASDNGGKRGSYTSDDIRELKGEHEEEEGEEEDELEEEQEESDNGYIQEQQDMAGARQFTNEEEDDGLEEQQEEYYKETNEEIDEDDDGFSEQMIKKISKEEVEDDLEYYPNDPINYNPLGKNQSHQARNSQSRSHEGETSKARAIQSVDVKHSHHMENDDDEEEEQTPEEEYEQEEEEEEEEQDEIVDEEEQDSQQREYYEGEYYVEGEGIQENDPRLAEYREEMEEVAEEEYEEENDTENAEPNHHLYQVHQSGKKSVKSKGKGGKAKKSGSKKAVKAPQPVVDYKKPKVEYRPLRPATAGMKRPQTAKSTKITKVNKSNPVRSSGRKSNESTSSRSKKMMHSKSEKHLYVAEEEEPEQTQSEGQEEYSEDKGMEPKEYQPGDSQVPSQHGGIEEEQEQYEQEYEEEQAQQIPDGNVFKILSENVMRVKENLRENRAIEDVPFDDEHTVKMIRHQKEQYKQYLKDFVKDHQMREKKYDQMRQIGAKNFHKKMRSENIRDQHLRKDFENQQKSLYFKMRDEKVNYLRRIHKTIFELEKKRIIDEKKEYMEFRKTRNVEAVNMIESIKNQYRHKLSILRENNANQQHERKIASEAQRTFIKTLENELRMDQMKEVERLKDKWRLEKERFDMMIKDEGFLEQKVMQLYKKGVF